MTKPDKKLGQTARLNTRQMTMIGLLGALTVILGLTPLGFIPIGPTRATVMHIPVIIGGIVYGPLVGGLTGLVFGLFSLFNAVAYPTPTSFAFMHPLVSILPRVLIGLVAYYSYQTFQKLNRRLIKFLFVLIWLIMIGYLLFHISQFTLHGEWLRAGLNGLILAVSLFIAYYVGRVWQEEALPVVMASVLGTVTNTAGVMTLIYILFAERFVVSMGLQPDLVGRVIFGVALVNGIPEVILSVLIVTGVVRALKKYIK